ncbi:hypothetical protein LTR86_011040 [Recurvomyces mirabilis]|nr:hypothetical protein LTR86_011040 [Recurvomyces mirabilis]
METPKISSAFGYTYQYAEVMGSKMAYVDTGPAVSDTTFVYLHGNPTSAYLWRNVIPYNQLIFRSIALDLIGMGCSDKPPNLAYKIADHVEYVEGFLDAILPTGRVVLVLHDWGAAIGLEWARRHQDRVGALVLMEFPYPIATWEDFPEAAREIFQQFRDAETGRKLLVEENFFIEKFLPQMIVRQMGDDELARYREPFVSPSSRKPVWRFPNEFPVEGSPSDVHDLMMAGQRWLLGSQLPKLIFYGTPGGLIPENKARWYAENTANVTTIGIGPGLHYLQEDNPHLIGRSINQWTSELRL